MVKCAFSEKRDRSSTGQSDGFLNRRFRVRFPAVPPRSATSGRFDSGMILRRYFRDIMCSF